MSAPISTTSIPWSQIRALSFDVFGTLIDWETGIYTAAHATLLGPHLPSSRAELLAAIERHDTAVQHEQPTLLQNAVIAEGLRRYARELRIVETGKLRADQVEAAVSEYGARIGDYTAFPDTVAALRRLGKRFRLIPLTNVDNASFARTRAGPLQGIEFDAVYTAEDVGAYKPDPRNFQYLLEHVEQDFGVRKEQLCHVAQSLFHDHGPAKEFGIQSVWVDRGGVMGGEVAGAQAKYGYALRVETLAELADIVERELGAA